VERSGVAVVGINCPWPGVQLVSRFCGGNVIDGVHEPLLNLASRYVTLWLRGGSPGTVVAAFNDVIRHGEVEERLIEFLAE